MVAGADIWVADHVVLLIAVALFLGAFYGLTHSIIGELGTVWARLAWGVAIIGVGLGLVFMLTEAVALPPLADTWANSSGVEKDLALFVFTLWTIYLGVLMWKKSAEAAEAA